MSEPNMPALEQAEEILDKLAFFFEEELIDAELTTTFLIGIAMAFRHPEWARALQQGAMEYANLPPEKQHIKTEGNKEQVAAGEAAMLDMLVEALPMEQVQ